MNRRSFLENSSKAGLGVIAVPGVLAVMESCGSAKKTSGSIHYPGGPTFQQRPLLFDYKGLEPNIDALTMEIHYTKHAAAYTKNMNEAIAAENAPANSIDALLSGISRYSAKLRNNAGGHYNHESFGHG